MTSTTPNDTVIGLRIQSIRKHRQMTQQALADAIGVSRYTVVRIERAQTPLSADLLMRIAESLHCGVDDLLVPFNSPIPHVHFRGRPKFCAAPQAPVVVLSDEEVVTLMKEMIARFEGQPRGGLNEGLPDRP